MNISLQQLKVFAAVARQRSFTRAAREFDLTQSAVSRCIRELEDTIDLRLFYRTTRQVELTAAGARLEQRVGRLIEEIELTFREERAAHNRRTGTVVIACDPITSSGWLPERLARGAAHFPNLTIVAKEQPQHAVLTAVEQGEVDFGVLSDTNFGGETDAFHMHPLMSTPLCAVLPHTHPLASGAALHWEALRNTNTASRLVTLNAEAGMRNVMERVFGEHRIDATRANECGHLTVALRMIELGIGVGVLPVSSYPDVLPASLVARPLVPDVSITTVLLRRRKSALNANVEVVWRLFVSTEFPTHVGISSNRGAIAANPAVDGVTQI
ncbi:Transcriptional regulator, LysR family [Paraburkholderia piptadeniae]|uniref:Transcriptional regulator, LysR family n=1 Tax=Paraburkholderia piptadeniae TaxID=1701573 RepID=A0A1N7RWY6_9BURK|nr:LysR family transcriptional regulator [Paraburkholderia piptadeniae]SIT39284.1 Transcriptional regulator, LysR family [Paraburkholderia piptadeniae]